MTLPYLVDVGHPKENPGEDDGVEDAHQGDAEHDPEGDEGDLPWPGDDAAEQMKIITEKSRENMIDLTCQAWARETQIEECWLHRTAPAQMSYDWALKWRKRDCSSWSPVVSYTPDTDGDAEDADHHQGDEHQDPLKHWDK